MTATKDYLASFCVIGDRHEGLPDELEALIGRLAARLRYWEVILVVGERYRVEVREAGTRLAAIRNLRILIVGDGESPYRRRQIAAAEALGDVVVITDPDEAASLDLVELADMALTAGQIVIATRRRARAEFIMLHGPVRVMSGYRVNTRDLRTLALPRAALTRILSRPTAGIDLRFEAKRAPERYVRHVVDHDDTGDRLMRGRRLDLLVEIVSASGPRFLKGFALIALATFIAACLFAAYAVGVVLFTEDVQPGWFTTNMALSGLTGFLSLWATVGSLAQARTMELMQFQKRDDVIEEIGNIAFFDGTEALNVAVSGTPHRDAAE